MRNKMPLTIANEPLVIPQFFESLENAPCNFPKLLSFQYWMIRAPEAMNKAHPINEKKRSEMKLYLTKSPIVNSI
jgi:hypothetical protein